MENTLKSRIEDAIKEKGMTKAELARQMQVEPQNLNNWMKRGSVPKHHMSKIEKILNRKIKYLEKGKGQKKLRLDNVELAPDLHKQVPLLGNVSAGSFIHTTELEPHEIETWLMSPKDYKGRAFGLRVTGDSMTSPTGKSYPHGSIAIFDSGNKTPNNGDLVLAKVSGADEVTFKKFVSDAGRQYLMPLNQSHPRIDDPFRVLAVFEYAIIF